jgi:hypothetical protein
MSSHPPTELSAEEAIRATRNRLVDHPRWVQPIRVRFDRISSDLAAQRINLALLNVPNGRGMVREQFRRKVQSQAD